jgi:hypothetical protein
MQAGAKVIRGKFEINEVLPQFLYYSRYVHADLSDEACSDIDLSSGELAKSEAAIQDSLARRAR